MIRVTCPYCKSSGYIAPPPPKTILMGPCPVCGEPVALYNNKVIALRMKMLGGGNFEEKIQSLAQIIMEYINAQDKPMDEEGLERIIRKAEGRLVEEGDLQEDETTFDVAPSIRTPDTEPITNEEIKDFFNIDLNLLAKKEYFDKHFG